LELNIEPPSGNIACTKPWNSLYKTVLKHISHAARQNICVVLKDLQNRRILIFWSFIQFYTIMWPRTGFVRRVGQYFFTMWPLKTFQFETPVLEVREIFYFLKNCMKFKYRWTSLYARDRDSKNRLSYNKFAYKKTKNSKFQDRLEKTGHFWMAYTRNCR